MKRNEAIELLEQYEKYLNESRMGSLLNKKSPINRFLESRWAKENLFIPSPPCPYPTNPEYKVGDYLDIEMEDGSIEHVSVVKITPHPEIPNSVYYEFSNGAVCRDIRLH